MNFYRFPEVSVVGIECMLADIEKRPQLWTWDTRRQEKVAVQKESISIPLRVGIPENNVHINHWQESKDSPLYRYFPACRGFLEAFTGHYGGTLARAAIIKLPLGKQVYPHIDEGTYYSKRDRFHLILSGQYRYIVENEEHIFKEGELWWFDNQKVHWSQTIGDKDRIAIIFDVKDSNWRKILGITG